MADNDKHKQEQVEGLLKHAREPVPARQALALLFPKAEQRLKTYLSSGSQDNRERIRARRISVRDFAPAYFRLDPGRATWGRNEIEAILRASDLIAAMKTVKDRIYAATENDRPRLRRLFLEELASAFGPERPFTGDWLRAIIDMSPMFIEARDETNLQIFFEDNSRRLWRVIVRGFESISPETRARLMSEVIPEARDISVLCDLFRAIAGDKHSDGAKDGRIETASLGEGTETLRQKLVDRIRQLAATGEIWYQADPRQILWFWWGCDLEEEVRSFTEKAMNDAKGLSSLLQVSIGLVRSSAGNYEQVADQYSRIVDLKTLEQKARELLLARASDEDRQLAQRFLSALANRGRR